MALQLDEMIEKPDTIPRRLEAYKTNTAKNQRSITVWIGSGRDQANTIKAMIDETFTPETGINVNLKLVNMGTPPPLCRDRDRRSRCRSAMTSR